MQYPIFKDAISYVSILVLVDLAREYDEVEEFLFEKWFQSLF